MVSTNHPRFKRKLLSSALILICSTGLSLAQSVPNTVELEEEELLTKKPTIDLSKIVVTAGGFAQEVKDAPASISVVSKQELENAPFRDVTDAIADVPGVVITGGGASQDISIRGMSSKYTLMMVDGKRQSSRETRPNSDGSGIEQGWIPPLAAIERIEVVRGPMSSRYGSDAMGGVINVITKKINDKLVGNVRTEFTLPEESDAGISNNTEFYFSGPIVAEKVGLQVFGKYSHRNEDKFKGGIPKREMRNIGGKLTFVPIEGQTFELDYAAGNQKRISTAGKSASRGSSHNDYKRNNYSARYLGEFDHGITTDLLYSYEKNRNESRDMVSKNSEISGNIILPLGAHTVTVGGQYRKEKLSDAGNQINPDLNKISRWNYSLFVEDEWWLTDSFSLTGGLRYEKDEKYGGELTPRIYGVWNVDDAWTVKGGISKGYSAPGLRQATDGWGQVTGGGSYAIDAVILGNSKLKPEKSTNYEIGTSFTPHNDFNISGTAFYTKFKNKIETDRRCQMDGYGGTDADCSFNGEQFWFIEYRENVDSAKLYGFELATQWKPIETLEFKANYTYNKTKVTSGAKKGSALNRIPEHNFNIKADWQATPQANLWAKASFHGKEAGTIGRGGKVGTEYKSYTLLDIGASYQFNRDISIYGGVYNITNKDVNDDQHGKNLEGRRYWMGINVDF